MGAKTWEHVVVQAPLRWATELIPAEVRAGDVTMRIERNGSAEGAFWGKGTRRFPATWSHGRTTGEGYVELRPHSSELAEAVVHLEAPRGPLSGLLWSAERLSRSALGLALELRYEVDSGAGSRLREGRKAGAVRTA